jgi:hypothetical protein
MEYIAVRIWTNGSEKCITSIFRVENLPSHLLQAGFLIFDSEDRWDTFLRNVGSHVDYTVLYPRRWQHTNAKFPLKNSGKSQEIFFREDGDSVNIIFVYLPYINPHVSLYIHQRTVPSMQWLEIKYVAEYLQNMQSSLFLLTSGMNSIGSTRNVWYFVLWAAKTLLPTGKSSRYWAGRKILIMMAKQNLSPLLRV